jgi:hypothetical protein
MTLSKPAPADAITHCRITAMPVSFGDAMPKVMVRVNAGPEQELLWYYPDEISFTEEEFIGLSLEQGRKLKFTKDRAYLRS